MPPYDAGLPQLCLSGAWLGRRSRRRVTPAVEPLEPLEPSERTGLAALATAVARLGEILEADPATQSSAGVQPAWLALNRRLVGRDRPVSAARLGRVDIAVRIGEQLRLVALIGDCSDEADARAHGEVAGDR